jgi:hypothetical protein
MSYDWWQTRFHADPAIIGRTIYLNRQPVRIAGVAPRDFQGPYTGLSLGLYLPLMLHDVIEGGPPRLEVRQAKSLTLLSRLKPGVSGAQASGMVRGAVRRLDQAFPKGTFDQAEVLLTPFWRSPAGAQAIMGPVMMALGGVVLVLLLGVQNAVAYADRKCAKSREHYRFVFTGSGRDDSIPLCRRLNPGIAAIVGLFVLTFCRHRRTNQPPRSW